jgi:peptidoglycan/LPS O-acetylase OafA/YrhL
VDTTATGAAAEQQLVRSDRVLLSSPFERLRMRLNRPNIPALDGIRAVSVALVMFYHADVQVSGPLGVLIFFVLSGFLITWLLLKEDEKYGAVSLRGFYWRRMLRIFPAFYCFWIVAVLLRFLNKGAVPWPAAWSSFFYVANYYHGIVRPDDQFLIHTWSLAVEEHFYLLWPALFVLLRRNRLKLAWVTLGIIAAVTAHRTVLCLSGTPYQYTRYTFDCRADGILWGCLAAIAVREGYLRSFWTAICKNVWLPLLPLSAIAFIAHTHVPDVIELTVLPPLVAVLICQLVLHSETGLWSWLNSGIARYIGQISYPLYLYHGVGLAVARRMPINYFVDLGLMVAIAVGIASMSYFLVEKPILKYKHLRRRQPLAAAA